MLASGLQRVRVAVSATSIPHIEYHMKTNSFSGILVTSLNAACQHLKYQCEYFIPPYNNLANDTLDGVLGALTNETADVGLAPIGITFSRRKHFHFIDSFLRTTYFVVIHKDNLLSLEQYEFVLRAIHSLYSNGVWIELFFISVIFIILGTLSDWYKRKLTGSTPISLGQLFSNWTFYVFGCGLGVAEIGDLDRSQSRRISRWALSKCAIVTTWLMYTFIVLSTLISRLPVMFAFDDLQALPFLNIEELLRSNFTVYGTDTAIDMLSASNASSHRNLSQQMLLLPSTPPSVDPESLYIELVKKEKTAVIVKEKTLIKMSTLNCDLMVAIDDFATLAVAALILPKGSPFQGKFELGYSHIHALGITQEGVYQFGRFVKNATRPRWHSSQSCYLQKVTNKPVLRRHTIYLKSLFFVFLIFTVILGIAGAVLFCEALTDYGLSGVFRMIMARSLTIFLYLNSCTKVTRRATSRSNSKMYIVNL